MDMLDLVAGKKAPKRLALLAGVSALALGFPLSAQAGNILLTGHDDDLHCTFGDSHGSPGVGPCDALAAEAKYVVNGDAKKTFLSIDQDGSGFGTELSAALTTDGYTVTTKKATTVTAADFDHTKYSAFAVASVITCGGCDNPVGTGTTLAGLSAAIAAFVDAGGGLLGMTSATDSAGFAYVPESVSATSIGHASGFVATANGLADIPGFDSVNGDETHNVFVEPGTGGESAAYKVAERDTTNKTADSPGGVPVTLYISGASITCAAAGTCVIHAAPEPASLALLGAGLFGFGLARRRRANRAGGKNLAA